MNAGKKFEEDFKKSVPDKWFYYRFKDGSAAWGGNDKVRFQSSNICDCMMYNGDYLYLCELKSHKGKSIPFSCIRTNQVEEMCKALKKGATAIFIFNMRFVNETYIVYADEVKDFMDNSPRKSIPIEWMKENGDLLGQTLKRTRYRYNIEKDFIKII